MKQTVFNKRQALRFTHFSRKSYALFACLGREVLVGVLAISCLTHAKADGISTHVAAAADSLRREEVKLDEVVITGSRSPLTDLQVAKIVAVVTRNDIDRAAGTTSISDVLKQVAGVDVRQRGAFGVQTDISVRGGNFDQIMLLLNGIPVSSPHTGHLSADFPVSLDDIERIEVLEGSASRVFGASAFNGVVNIVTRQKAPQTVSATLSAGSYGYANGNATVYADAGNFYTNVGGGYTRSDGATENSAFTSSRFFWQGGITGRCFSVDAQLGYSYKPFEANTFYGASSTDQWESNERLMGAISADVAIGKVHLAPRMYWNRWFDHYQWHRDSPAGENYHRSDAGGGALSAWLKTRHTKTSIGVDVRQENIWSTKLGVLQPENKWLASGGHDANSDIKYKYNDARTITSAFLQHDITLEKFTLMLGATAIHTDLTGMGVYPGVDFSYRPNDDFKFFASWNMGMRLPTFTDLYYSGAKIEGNSNLVAEKTSDFQIGVRNSGSGYLAELQLFYSHKRDMIDWVTYHEAGDDIFHSVNFKMDNWGAEFYTSLMPQYWFGPACPVQKLTARYSYINQDSKYGVSVIQSKYAMEYLRHKVSLSLDTRIWKKLNANISWRWQQRTSIQNPSYAITDAKLSWDAKKYSIFVDAQNLFDKQYFDYIAVKQPGIVVVGGLKLRL